MRLFYVTYLIPAHVESGRASRLESGIHALLHALRSPPASSGVGSHAPLCGVLVQLAEGPAWLATQLIALSPDVRFLIVPRDESQPCLAHPPPLLSLLQINRADWELTCVKFSQTAASLPKRRRGFVEAVKDFFRP